MNLPICSLPISLPPICSCPVEGFTTLLKDPAHWEFEGFLMLIDNLLIGGLLVGVLWPKLKGHWMCHVAKKKG